jgi:zinc protease
MSKLTNAVASRALACFLSAALFLGTTASGQSAQAPAHKLPTIPFEKYTLKNGLEVILSEDHTLPLVSVNIWYHVGPANEKAGRTGFAHLFEHMMFEGSQHVGAKAHFGYLEAAGATEINGTTEFDRTNYYETVPSNQLDLALWLESDRMGYLPGKLDIQNLATSAMWCAMNGVSLRRTRLMDWWKKVSTTSCSPKTIPTIRT